MMLLVIVIFLDGNSDFLLAFRIFFIALGAVVLVIFMMVIRDKIRRKNLRPSVSVGKKDVSDC